MGQSKEGYHHPGQSWLSYLPMLQEKLSVGLVKFGVPSGVVWAGVGWQVSIQRIGLGKPEAGEERTVPVPPRYG